MKKIGLLGAMPEEIEKLYLQMENRRQHMCGGVTFYEGTLSGKSVVLCCAGMGKAQAAAAVQLLITSFGADAIVFSGIAGNMSSRVGIGDVVIGGTVVYHDGEPRMFAQSYPHLEEFHSDASLVAAAEKACSENNISYIVGKIATGDCFVGDSATKQSIAAKCAPDCVEMEGAAVAHIAAKNDVPFVILRAMSDNADENAFETLVVKQFDISEYCDRAAHICASLIRSL
ncbi:5'-methylthioadenosine/adenosylhomocysteine nucleosidase [uncultured Ruthenibacterium sp.]|uniref:5'-methylthioadenosine/adenosylhomocysteine nucleosidase n=1 Tax=uncultured Ruthenibacterium sp. TaxID=1905347 RepID=UPI00349E9FDC